MKVWATYKFGGSIGEISADRKDNKIRRFSGVGMGRLLGYYNTREEAKEAGKQYVQSFSGGSRNYYHPKYRVVKEEVSEEELQNLYRRFIWWDGKFEK